MVEAASQAHTCISTKAIDKGRPSQLNFSPSRFSLLFASRSSPMAKAKQPISNRQQHRLNHIKVADIAVARYVHLHRLTGAWFAGLVLVP